jgi:site-specific DNA recombinase
MSQYVHASLVEEAHRWLDGLLLDPHETTDSIAKGEGKTERSIRMTLSLAFLAPDIVKAAVDGKLPRSFGLKRLTDLPMGWVDQRKALGLNAPATSQPTIA